MNNTKERGFLNMMIFAVFIFLISFLSNQFHPKTISSFAVFAPFAAGILAFFFQIFIDKKPIILLYSKGYPYRRLKPYGAISAFLLFEFIIVWGLHTRQIGFLVGDLFLITVALIGAIAYYHSFVRMKISLRFLSLAILIPALSAGVALGLGSYFKILKFVLPQEPVGGIVFFNTVYWILFYIFMQMVCEEPAFRGYLMQGLLAKGEIFATIVSSLIFATWRFFFLMHSGIGNIEMALMFICNFIIASILALLFIKGRNLLVAVIFHGIIDGLNISIFIPAGSPGIRQYVDFITPRGEIQLIAFWIFCLFIGLILLTFIPRKKLYVR